MNEAPNESSAPLAAPQLTIQRLERMDHKECFFCKQGAYCLAFDCIVDNEDVEVHVCRDCVARWVHYTANMQVQRPHSSSDWSGDFRWYNTSSNTAGRQAGLENWRTIEPGSFPPGQEIGYFFAEHSRLRGEAPLQADDAANRDPFEDVDDIVDVLRRRFERDCGMPPRVVEMPQRSVTRLLQSTLQYTRPSSPGSAIFSYRGLDVVRSTDTTRITIRGDEHFPRVEFRANGSTYVQRTEAGPAFDAYVAGLGLYDGMPPYTEAQMRRTTPEIRVVDIRDPELEAQVRAGYDSVFEASARMSEHFLREIDDVALSLSPQVHVSASDNVPESTRRIVEEEVNRVLASED